MRFIVLVPFGVIIIAAILGAGIVAIVGTVVVGLMELLFVIIKFLFNCVCFGGGSYLIVVGAYRVVRVFLKGLQDRIYPSWYVVWVGSGLTAFSWGFNAFFSDRFIRQIPHQQSRWFGFITDTYYTPEDTGWHTLSSLIGSAGLWILLAGIIYLIIESLVRHWSEVSVTVGSAVSSGAKKVKKGLDGPTST